jgi:hypothetical protein
VVQWVVTYFLLPPIAGPNGILFVSPKDTNDGDAFVKSISAEHRRIQRLTFGFGQAIGLFVSAKLVVAVAFVSRFVLIVILERNLLLANQPNPGRLYLLSGRDAMHYEFEESTDSVDVECDEDQGGKKGNRNPN